MGFFSKGIKQGITSGALVGILEQVPTAQGAANAANARKKQESINAINLDRLNQARLDSKTMVADQLASRESGWRKQQKGISQLNKLALQQSLYKSKIGTVV